MILVFGIYKFKDETRQSTKLVRAIAERDVGSKPYFISATTKGTSRFLAVIAKYLLVLRLYLPLPRWHVFRVLVNASCIKIDNLHQFSSLRITDVHFTKQSMDIEVQTPTVLLHE